MVLVIPIVIAMICISCVHPNSMCEDCLYYSFIMFLFFQTGRFIIVLKPKNEKTIVYNHWVSTLFLPLLLKAIATSILPVEVAV